MLQLDLQFFAGEKTEKATPKKRQEARKKGQAAKSQDVSTALILLLIFLYFSFGAQEMLKQFMLLITYSYEQYLLLDITEKNLFSVGLGLLPQIAIIMGPIMLVALVGGIFTNYIQIGFLFSTETIKPKLEKINPINGAKRIFSLRALVELLKASLKITLISIAAFALLWTNHSEVIMLSQKNLLDGLVTLAKLVFQMGLAASLILLFLSVMDYMYQKFDFEKSIRMSKQDIKDEFKNIEGDPHIKSKIKQKQREMAMSRMMQEVPKADVVITNPTHYAIALKYDEQSMATPYVVASGVDYLAQKIKYVASNHDIVMVENRPLARALYERTKVGDPIPEEFFKAVAEILAYVYRLKNKI